MAKESAIMKQFRDLKSKHPDAVLLFRCGDFYESYDEDAVECAKILGITLTKRSSDGEKMAGFPYHALDTYLPRLIRAGKRVAICDQLEDPKLTKRLVKRGITELVSPATSNNETSTDNTTMATKNMAKNESKNAAQQQVNNEVESVSVGEVTLDSIQPVMVPVEGTEYQVKDDSGKAVTFSSVTPNIGYEPAEDKPAVTMPLGSHGTLVIGGVPKHNPTTEKPKPAMPKRDKNGKFLKKDAAETKAEPKSEPTPQAKYQYVTYDVKKVNKTTKKEYTVTGSKIVGFSLTDPIYLAGPAFCGAISTETVGDKTVGTLRFSHKWTPAVKDVCDLLNSGNATIEGCVAIINGAKAERTERIQNRIAQREERKAQKAAQAAQEQPAAPAMSSEEQAMFDLFKKFMAGDKEAMAKVNAVLKAA